MRSRWLPLSRAVAHHNVDTRHDLYRRLIHDMMRIVAMPDFRALAARLFTMFGNRLKADAILAQARRTFAEA